MKFVILAILLSFINLSFSFTAQQLATRWTSYKATNKRRYSNRLEEALRFQIFKANLEFIEKHNAKADAGEVSYRLAMNQFGDMTPNEFSKLNNGFDMFLGWPSSSVKTYKYNANLKTPKSAGK